MRELQAFEIYATSRILKSLAENSMFSALSSSLVTRVPVRLGKEVSLPGDLAFELFEVPGKVPLYEERHKSASRVEATVGVRLSVRGRTAHYIPGCAAVPSELKRRLMGSDVLLFDGTLWSDEELLIEGVGTKTGERMGHISISGVAGSLAELSDLDIKRKIYTHINNTNPVLIDGSPERNHVEMKGWKISYDGMEIMF
ncbi:coenzyme PQQ biosynthesis protein B [Rhodoligotrophos appendicifer]